MKLASLPISVMILGLVTGCGDDAAGPDGQHGTREFDWSGVVAAGDRIEIKGVIGDVTASAASGSEVVVHATLSGRESDPADVTIEVVEHADGVTICAVYPDVPGQRPNECLPGDRGNMSVRDNDVVVDFTVSVPAGVVFAGRTVSGDVRAQGLQGDAFVRSVSGNLIVSTTGIAEGSTVSGGINASIGRADWGRDLAFTSVSGNVAVEVPSNTNAAVQASTVSGTIDSDFPLTGTAVNQQGTLGSGGPTLTLSTVSGDVRLRRGPAT